MESPPKPKPDTKRIVEALLFASDGPLSVRRIRRILPEAEVSEIRALLKELGEDYEREGKSYELREIENGFQVLTQEEYFPWIRRLRNDIKAMRLSRAGIETLAIIAYRQPVVRTEIEQIRGVDVGGVLKTLLEKGLITLRGRAEGVGRPLLYGTSDYFLNHFGLKNLDELPRIEELSEIMKSGAAEEIEEEATGLFGPRVELPDDPEFESADEAEDEDPSGERPEADEPVEADEPAEPDHSPPSDGEEKEAVAEPPGGEAAHTENELTEEDGDDPARDDFAPVDR